MTDGLEIGAINFLHILGAGISGIHDIVLCISGVGFVWY